jgi:1-acyl-sn-glycerol-3-phosphate acyltransferase
MLGATAAAILLSPVIVVGALVYDLLRIRIHLPTLRLFLFVVQYLINDSTEIFLCGLYWLAAGFGTHLDSEASIRRHERTQRWSIDVMARRADQFLGLKIDMDAEGLAALDEPGPVIVLCRHVNVVDSSLPALLYQERGYRVRSVMMAELLADPGFDLLYGRLGSVFVARDNGPQARRAVASLQGDGDPQTAMVIFPEGRLFRTELLRRYLDKLAQSDAARSQRLHGLRHVLPPRPGGVNALLDANPGIDVVVIAHVGLDPYPTFMELARSAPLTAPLRVTAWRFPRAVIPEGKDERVAWLDDIWCRVDDWVDVWGPTIPSKPLAWAF